MEVRRVLFAIGWKCLANRGESLRVSDSLGLKMAVNLCDYLRIFCAIGLKLMVRRWECVEEVACRERERERATVGCLRFWYAFRLGLTAGVLLLHCCQPRSCHV